jgi:hypothetical protein
VFSQGTGGGSYSSSVNGTLAGGYTVDLTVNLQGSGGLQVLIRSTVPNAIINAVNVTVNLNGTVTQRWTNVSLTGVNGYPTDSIGIVRRFVQVGGNGDLRIAGIVVDGYYSPQIGVNLPGVIGDPENLAADDVIAADRIATLRARGNINADIIATQPANPGTVATVERVQSTEAGIFGHIRALYGAIDDVTAATDIGSSSNRPVIEARLGIKSITANSIWADINARANGGADYFWRLQTRTGGFVGSLLANSIVSGTTDGGLHIAGALDANVTVVANPPVVPDVREPITAASIPVGRVISIDGSILGSAPNEGRITVAGSMAGSIIIGGAINGPIEIGDSLTGGIAAGSANNPGLSAQVVVNRNNARGMWTTGTVLVRGTMPLLPRPFYSSTSASIGGGAVGHAPFNIHSLDCEPVNGSYMRRADFEPEGADPNGAVVRYYGPIELADPQVLPRIEWQMRDSGGVNRWCDVSAMFTVTVRPADVTIGRDRAIRIRYIGTAGDLATGHYRLHLDPGVLLCSGVTGSPDAVGDYYFSIGLDCSNQQCNGTVGPEDFIDPGAWSQSIDCNGNNIADDCELRCDGAYVDHDGDGKIDMCEGAACPCNFNGDEFLNSQDFFDFLTCFFAGPCPPGQDADYNNDGLVNSQDFFDFLACFFSPTNC